VHGRVIDSATHAPVPDARVVLAPIDRSRATDGRSQTVETDVAGQFEFADVPAGPYELTVSTVGYIFVRRRLVVAPGATIELTLPLAEGAGTYEEAITVTTDGDRGADGPAPRALGSAALQELRGVVTDDPMRAVQALPGVVAGDDFQAGFSVRGSPFRHAGVTIDGFPAARLLHVVRAEANSGSISMINTDVLSGAALVAGARPARDGDWIGPTLAFELREGSRDRSGGRLALSGTSASILAEGPVGSGRRGSWLVSLRKSYLDWLVRKVESGFDSTLGFWDGHMKAVFEPRSGHELQLFVIGGDAAYHEREASAANGLLRARSGSTLAGMSWRHASSTWVQRHRVFFLGTEFQNSGARRQELARGYTQDAGWRGDVTWPAGRAWLFEAGAAVESLRSGQTLRRYDRTDADELVAVGHAASIARARATAAWIGARRPTDGGGLTLGVRGAGRTDVPGVAWSPWVMVDRRIGRVSLRAGAGGLAQFTDPLVLLAAERTPRPERARSADAGFSHQLTATMDWSVDAFVRDESDILTSSQDDRLDPLTGEHLVASPFPRAIAALEGRAYGVDVAFRRRSSSGVTGWAGYTWAKARARDNVTGERYDADFDQRHTFNMVASARLSYRSAVGLKLRVGSNTPLVGYFERDGDELRLAAVRNRVRLPTYARLDARATRTFTFSRRRLTLFVEVMNVLNRENVGPANPSVRASLQVTGFAERLIPRVPSAGFVVEF
jgi:hypothetical protein